jgi:hypothetical protein
LTLTRRRSRTLRQWEALNEIAARRLLEHHSRAEVRDPHDAKEFNQGIGGKENIMAIDLTKPFKMGGVTHRGLVPPGDPMFSGGPMIAGRRLSEWLGVSPEKTTAEDKVTGPKGKAKGKR